MDTTDVNVPQRNNRGELLYRTGRPYRFVTTRPFTLGATGLQVREGTDVLFDGQKAEIDGQDYVLAFLRGAVKQGWLVLEEEYNAGDASYNQRASANIQVRPADGKNPMHPVSRTSIAATETDEREVGGISTHAANTRTANNNYVRGKTGVNVAAPGSKVRTQQGMMVVEEQDGVVVQGRVLKTAAGERAKNTRLELGSEKAADALRQAANLQIEPGVGISQEEMLERMTPDEQEAYLSSKSAYRQQYVEDAPQPAIRTVGKVRAQKTTHEIGGITVRNSVGGGVSISDGEGEIVGSIGDKQESFEQEGIRFNTTNGPTRKAPPPARVVPVRQAAKEEAPVAPKGPCLKPEVRLRMAKSMCAEFPENYDFALPTKKKLARITADFEDRHDVLQAIFAAEDDVMRGLLATEFPAAFA